jgi:hypothetical protein
LSRRSRPIRPHPRASKRDGSVALHHHVSAVDRRGGDVEAHRLGGLRVDDQLEFDGLDGARHCGVRPGCRLLRFGFCGFQLLSQLLSNMLSKGCQTAIGGDLMKLVFEGATAATASVWLLQMKFQELQLFGSPKHQGGKKNLLLVRDASFDAEKSRLELDATGITVINIGASTETIVVDIGSSLFRGAVDTDSLEPNPKNPQMLTTQTGSSTPVSGPGDRALITMIKVECPQLTDVAEALLRNIRQEFPGDLRECKRRLFVEDYYNFWAIQVQPRAGNLMIFIKGDKGRFLPSRFELKPARSAYTRFYIDRIDEVQPALELIKLAASMDDYPRKSGTRHRTTRQSRPIPIALHL